MTFEPRRWLAWVYRGFVQYTTQMQTWSKNKELTPLKSLLGRNL
jgi:hypothetical protein